jgi:hypothetical protein
MKKILSILTSCWFIPLLFFINFEWFFSSMVTLPPGDSWWISTAEGSTFLAIGFGIALFLAISILLMRKNKIAGILVFIIGSFLIIINFNRSYTWVGQQFCSARGWDWEWTMSLIAPYACYQHFADAGQPCIQRTDCQGSCSVAHIQPDRQGKFGAILAPTSTPRDANGYILGKCSKNSSPSYGCNFGELSMPTKDTEELQVWCTM